MPDFVQALQSGSTSLWLFIPTVRQRKLAKAAGLKVKP